MRVTSSNRSTPPGQGDQNFGFARMHQIPGYGENLLMRPNSGPGDDLCIA
jgi:hypothetical protein